MDTPGPHDPGESTPARLVDLFDDIVVWIERRRHLVSRTVAALVTIAVVLAGGWWAVRPRLSGSIEDQIPMVTLEPTVAAGASDPVMPSTSASSMGGGSTGEASVDEDAGGVPDAMTVHVAGAVRSPGVYEFDVGARVVDAVDAAGGALDGADLSAMNLAAPLVDGSQVRIPLEGETPPAPLGPVGGGGGPGLPTPAADAPVSLNQATAADLERLPGVGPAIAAAIITWRTNNGPFVSVDQLLDVPGIGPAKLAAMADQVVVG
ncbi:MAG: ComEA family DNA-binding protein [Acidimicrobiales bacterium]